MLVRDLMSEEVVACGPHAPVSQIIAVMLQKKIHNVPIITEGDKKHRGGEVAGVVTANRIAARELDPSKAKAKALMTSTAVIAPDESVERAAELILSANLRAIPVMDGGLVGMISEQDLMRAVSVGGTAADAMKAAVSLDESEKIGKAKEIMVHRNFSRVVATKNGKYSGVVGTLDIMRVLGHGWQSYPARSSTPQEQGRGRGFVEKRQIDETPIKNAIHKSPVVKPDESLAKVAEFLRTNEEVIVEDGGIGIITPKDILRLFVKARELAQVQIVGLDRTEDALDVAMIHQKASETMRRLARSADLQTMKIYIKKHRKQGFKTKFSVKAELPSSLGTFISSKSHGKNDRSYSNLVAIVQHALDDLERQVRKRQEKFRKADQRDFSGARAAKEEGFGLRERRIRKGH